MRSDRDIEELVSAGVITGEDGARISAYYAQRASGGTGRMIAVFSVLGSLLVGLGVILVVAHNWDELGKPLKLIFALLPVLTGQVLCINACMHGRSLVWRECAGVWLFLSIGASIALISQIYHLHGDFSGFLLLWMILSAPLIYVPRSSVASLLYIAGITWYCASRYGYIHQGTFNYYPLLLLIALPGYFAYARRHPQSTFTAWHHWLIPLSLCIAVLVTGGHDNMNIQFSYCSLFALFYMLGHSPFAETRRGGNGYLVTGSIGLIALCISLSFSWYWQDKGVFDRNPPLTAFSVSIFIVALFLFIIRRMTMGWRSTMPLEILLFASALIFWRPEAGQFLMNLLLLGCAVWIIRDGSRSNELGKMNFGLLVITSLVSARFFDTHISFIARGVMFLATGILFFAANYRLLKRRKINETA